MIFNSSQYKTEIDKLMTELKEAEINNSMTTCRHN